MSIESKACAPDMAEIERMVSLLRGLARHEHSDHGIGNEAADLIVALARDARRLNWLEDPEQRLGEVLLPCACVEQNLDSMRAAIDAAIDMHEKGIAV